MTDTEAVFHLFYRRNPFGGGFAVACGLEYVTGFLSDLRFEADDVAYLATLRGAEIGVAFGVDAVYNRRGLWAHRP